MTYEDKFILLIQEKNKYKKNLDTKDKLKEYLKIEKEIFDKWFKTLTEYEKTQFYKDNIPF